MLTLAHFTVIVPGWKVRHRMAVAGVPLGAFIAGMGFYLPYRYLKEYPVSGGEGLEGGR